MLTGIASYIDSLNFKKDKQNILNNCTLHLNFILDKDSNMTYHLLTNSQNSAEKWSDGSFGGGYEKEAKKCSF